MPSYTAQPLSIEENVLHEEGADLFDAWKF